MCGTVPTAGATLYTLLTPIEDSVKLQTILASLFAAAAMASGCASSDARFGSSDYRHGSVRSNEGYYGVIDSIESGAGAGALVGHEIGETNGRQDVYLIRVRFDDRSFQTVTQASLDGLGVGDSVRIERDRVRRY